MMALFEGEMVKVQILNNFSVNILKYKEPDTWTFENV